MDIFATNFFSIKYRNIFAKSLFVLDCNSWCKINISIFPENELFSFNYNKKKLINRCNELLGNRILNPTRKIFQKYIVGLLLCRVLSE